MDEKKPDKLFELEGYCNPRKNEVLESHRFWNVQYQESFYNFLTELTTQIIFTVQGKLQELLLCEDKLSLDKAIQICRAYEQSNKHVKELRENNSASHAINKVTHENKPPKSKKPNYKQQPRKFQDKPVLTTSSTLHCLLSFSFGHCIVF